MPERHCLSCGRVHAEVTCPECLATARGDLLDIVRMCGYPLLEEVLSKGAQSDAAMLLGPAANTEAWRYRATSAMFGRVDSAYLEDCRDEAHPLWTLGWIENEWREAFGHDDAERTTIQGAARYIGEMLHVVAGTFEMPDGSQPPEFGNAKADCKSAGAHLEDVLSEGERDETEHRARRAGSETRADPPRRSSWTATTTTARAPTTSGGARAASPGGVRPTTGCAWGPSMSSTPRRRPSPTWLPGPASCRNIRRWASKTTKRIDDETVELPPKLKPSGKSRTPRLYRVADVMALRDGDEDESWRVA